MKNPIGDVVRRIMDAEAREVEALLEYAAELAIRTDAPVTVLRADPWMAGRGRMWIILRPLRA